MELLLGEPAEVQEALKKEVTEQLIAAREKHEDMRRGLPSNVPEDIEVYVG